MSNPTTPFGWQMPTNTDLVTDLPADFEVFGQAVATSMQDLLGGTTGQLLSKASGTDMDFTWTTPTAGDIEGVTAGIGISGGGTSGTVTVTNSMATAFTTSGDLIQATGSGTFARLGTGTNGQYLTTNGTTNSWGTISAGGMTLISTTTLSGATVTLSSIPQTYNNLQLVISGMNWNTSNAQPSIQFNGVTGNFYYSGTIGSAVHYRSNSTFWLTDNDWTRTNTTNSTVFNLYNYASTTTYKSFDYRGKNDQPTGGTRAFQFGGNWNDDTAAISSISIYAGGNTFAGGTVLLYGVK